jgi:hypothetical protein
MRPYRILGETREWRPGDGLACAHKNRASAEIPCGPPVKTNVRQQSGRPGGPTHTVVSPLCKNHAMKEATPSAALIRARKVAAERLAAAHWDEYQQFLRDAIDDLMSEDAA